MNIYHTLELTDVKDKSEGLSPQAPRRVFVIAAENDRGRRRGIGFLVNPGGDPVAAPIVAVRVDAAGMTTFRSLALLASHADEAALVRNDVENVDPLVDPMPHVRATVLESLRLWPTTPLLLRETSVETEWETGILPANTAILIFAPFSTATTSFSPTPTDSRRRYGSTSTRRSRRHWYRLARAGYVSGTAIGAVPVLRDVGGHPEEVRRGSRVP